MTQTHSISCPARHRAMPNDIAWPCTCGLDVNRKGKVKRTINLTPKAEEWVNTAVAAGVTLPQGILLNLQVAVDMQLDDPFGRACYAYNRTLNAGVKNAEYTMTHAAPETAARWREHVLRGGAFKRLDSTQEDYKKWVRDKADRQLSDGARLKRVVKRIRRAVKNGTLEGTE